MEEPFVGGEKRVTIHDIARATGVSVATVSGAFSGKRRMSEFTRNLVLTKAQEMGFSPDPHAQRLSTGRFANTVALLMTSDLGVFTQMMWKLQFLLKKRGFEVHDRVLSMHLDDVEEEQTKLLHQIALQNPQAVLCRSSDLQTGAIKILREYVNKGGVLVCWGNVMESGGSEELAVDHVLLNPEENGFLQANHLIELGHRKLGLYGHYSLTMGGTKSTLAGFKRALDQSGLEFRPEWTGEACCYEEAGMQHAANFLALKERPTGVCIINDNAAAAFVHSVMRAGLQVPGDVSVVGHDNTAAAQAAFVPLTTIRRPVEDYALTLVEVLCSRLSGENQGPPHNQILHGELIVRESTAPPRTEMTS